MNTTTPYLEIFTCRLIGEDGCEHDGDCEWGFACNLCGLWLDGLPCPEHAPLHVPGLQVAECEAIPPHPRTFFLASEGYPGPCLYCSHAAQAENHAGCAHSHHWPWRRWKLTRAAAYRLTMLGVSPGAWTIHDGHCRGCLSGFSPRLSGYVLGWPKWKWGCILKGRHWPGVLVFADICGKCCPCPGCSSVTHEHRYACPVGAS